MGRFFWKTPSHIYIAFGTHQHGRHLAPNQGKTPHSKTVAENRLIIDLKMRRKPSFGFYRKTRSIKR